MYLLLLSLLTGYVACVGIAAEPAATETLTIVAADGRRWQGTLEALDLPQLTLQPDDDGPAKTVDIGAIVRVGDATPITLPHSVWLVDGSRLAATGLSFDGEACQAVNSWLEVSIPLNRVYAIQWNGPVAEDLWRGLERQVDAITGPDDAMILVNGDLRRGTLELSTVHSSARQTEPLQFSTPERSFELAMRQVRVVVPSPALRQWTEPADGDVWVGLADGSRLRVRHSPAASRWVLACGQAIEWKAGVMDNSLLRLLAPCDPALGLLATEPPLRYRAVPFFGKPLPLRRWADGYSNGLQVAATSRLVYPLAGQQRVCGGVTVQAPEQTEVQPACRFTVQTADASGEVTTRWQSAPVPGGDSKSVVEFDVDISGGRLLILGADSVSGGDLPRPIWVDTVVSGG